MFLEISPNSQENTYARVSFIKKEPPAQVFSCEFWDIFKNTFWYRTPPVVASENFVTIEYAKDFENECFILKQTS